MLDLFIAHDLIQKRANDRFEMGARVEGAKKTHHGDLAIRAGAARRSARRLVAAFSAAGARRASISQRS